MANVGPGGLTSAEEYSADGEFTKSGSSRAPSKSRIQIVGYDKNANPIMQNKGGDYNDVHMRTMDEIDGETRTVSVRQKFGGG